MKVLCSACEAAEASVLCCADEAALCAACDRQVHAANRLAGKHHRLPLRNPAGGSANSAAAAEPPKCDICQESSGFFFCLEDRAVLCRNCDVAVHTANEFVSSHNRFLLTGVQVGLESITTLATERVDTTMVDLESPTKSFCTKTRLLNLRSEPVEPLNYAANASTTLPGGSIAGGLQIWSIVNEEQNLGAVYVQEHSKSSITKRSPRRTSSLGMFPPQGGIETDSTNKVMHSGGFAESLPDWPLDEFFRFSEYNNSYRFNDQGSSKADSGKLGSSDGSTQYRSGEDDPDSDRFLGQVPEMSWMPSPPTASGLHWHRNPSDRRAETMAFVPDIGPPPDPFIYYATPANVKRRRQL